MMPDVIRLGPDDLTAFRAMMTLFADAFEDPEKYNRAPRSDEEARVLLSKDHVIALAVMSDNHCLGGLLAYVLDKPEQPCAEVYLYDLAVADSHRRQGIATALIEALKAPARAAGAEVIFVQADYVDPPAIALYTKLGAREEVLHFDISVAPAAPRA